MINSIYDNLIIQTLINISLAIVMATSLLRLKTLSRVPTKDIKLANNGLSYPNKPMDLKDLNHRVFRHKEMVLNVMSIDTFNNSKKLMPNWKQVMAKYRNEPFFGNIGIYTEPLLLSNDWSSKHVNILNRVWSELYNKNAIDEFVDNSDDFFDDWVCTSDIEGFKKKYDYGNFLIPYLEQWKFNGPWNFRLLFTALRNFKKFNVTDFSATGSSLVPKRNQLVEGANWQVEMIVKDVERIEFYKTVSNKKSDLRHFNFDFYGRESSYDGSGDWLRAMHIAATETLGGIEFIRDYNDDLSYLEHSTGQAIIQHPRVAEQCDTSWSQGWAIRKLSHIYKNDWNTWRQKNHN